MECKAKRSIRLADYIRQANKEADHAGFAYGVAVGKVPGRSVEDGYAVMDLVTCVRVLAALREAGERRR
ncbi:MULTISPECIES: hypothetical protein [unclassified Streptomyces]|uniref:hypothetical protein n=1 Tax=unclassified Streptomyces TaxID=2593676 RepID=UPI000363062C|nr:MULTISPECIES: hypothetical protein [unclassified Streptomyces]MYT30129.1 hypothetical protein [Streptomyces sp. SID8354]